MANLTIDFTTTKLAANNSSIIKLLVFDIKKLTLALPILQVQKVIKNQPIHGSGLSHINLTHLEDQEVAIIDLHQKLFKISQSQIASTAGYFIISKNITGEALGIRIEKAPTLIDVPVAKIRLIPESYRRADTLAIASHVAVILQKDDTPLTIFILDLKQLV